MTNARPRRPAPSEGSGRPTTAVGLGRTHRPAALLAGALILQAVATASALAQDLEVLADRAGIPLPAGYWAQVAADPDAYSFRRALFNRTGLRVSGADPREAGPLGPREHPSGRASAADLPYLVAAPAAPARAPVAGMLRLPVVLALFADSPEPHIDREAVQRALFDGPSTHGTITEAYLEMSRGALTVTGDVFPWVRTTGTLTEILGEGDGLGRGSEVGRYFREALDRVDGSVDFGLYDNDGPDGQPNSGDDDGYVDVITFEYLEVAASCGGPGIWPHRSRMEFQGGGPYVTGDASLQDSVPFLRIDDYITQSVADCTGQVVQDAGTISHEFGHALGLPDYYHGIGGSGPFERRWVLGCWGLMAAGAWGCGEVPEERVMFGPTHLTAYSKNQLGWVELVDPGSVRNQEIFLDPVQASGTALRIPLDEEGREYLIAEYRTRTGFDEELPASGVLVYKLDLAASRYPDPASGEPYFLSLVERDGDRALVRTWHEGGDRGRPGDVWGLDGVAELHAESEPPLRMSDGSAAPVTIHEVSLVEGRARLVVSTAGEPSVVPPAGSLTVMQVRSFVRALRIAGGTMPYEVQGAAPEGVTLRADGDDLLLAGSLLAEGPHELLVTVTDARGRSAPEVALSLETVPWAASTEELLQPLLGSDLPPLTPGEQTYLDAAGNANGRYDVGDLRKWLRDSGGG